MSKELKEKIKFAAVCGLFILLLLMIFKTDWFFFLGQYGFPTAFCMLLGILCVLSTEN